MTSLHTLVKLPVQIAESAGSIVGLRFGTEEPHHRVTDRIGDVEIRVYGPRVAAETVVAADDDAARSIGFRRLARYIFGGNHSGTSIAMTAPVAQSEAEGEQIAMTAPVAQSGSGTGSVIRFYMPSKYSIETLPQPDSAAVRLVTVPAETVAVLRYSGDRSPAVVARKGAELLDVLAASDYQAEGEPVAWFYDPPFTLPFRRRNEAVVPVTTR
jgi:hypothetical protein